MTVRATKFTPEVLLSAPRRSAGIPNSKGDRILYTVSTYDFDSHKTTSELRVLDPSKNESTLLTDASGVSEPNWIDDDQVLFLAPGENGKTLIKLAPLDDFEDSQYLAGEINASAQNVRVKLLEDGRYAFAITALSNTEGDPYNPSDAKETFSSGRVFDSMFVRHWDTWQTENKNSIFYGVLHAEETSKSKKFQLGTLTNVLFGTGLECPIPPFGGIDHYDLNQFGCILFVAKDPIAPEAFNTKCNLYLAIMGTSLGKSTVKVEQVADGGFEGAASSPVFAPNGKKCAYLKMRKNGYEADKNHAFIIPDIERPSWIVNPLGSNDGLGRWDRSPSSIVWTADGSSLFLVAEDEGSGALWIMPEDPMDEYVKPKIIMKSGTVSSVIPLTKGEGAFVSASSFIDNSTYYRVNPFPAPGSVELVSSNTKLGSSIGLTGDQVSSFWCDGAKDQVHSWIVRPSDFDPDKKYPVAFLIHGGPQGAWLDGWSSRWNPAVFAEQGYVVVCPNPTGSTGFGQDFTDAIRQDWGGAPYLDIVKTFEAVASDLPFADTSRAVCLGASYGGYMTNWIQGQPLGRRFAALVTHDGLLSFPSSQLASDELYFPAHDFGGAPWQQQHDSDSDSYKKWDPSAHLAAWSTPHLIIHSSRDYRISLAEGLAAFGALQWKGVESRLLTFPDENHWVLKQENSLLWHACVLDWINRFVGLGQYTRTEEGRKAAELMEGARRGAGKFVGYR